MPSNPAPVAIVTGGAGPGIGSAISSLLARRAYEVWVVDVDGEASAQLVTSLINEGHAGHALTADVADGGMTRQLVAEVAATSGRIDALVNSAGIGLNQPLAVVSDDDYDRVMGVNLRGAFIWSRAVIPFMIDAGGGAIVNIGSVHALGAERLNAVYASTKAGLVGLTRGTAADYGSYGIRCNIVHPGAVNSPQTRELLTRRGKDPDTYLADFLVQRQLVPRGVEADDIAKAVAFLLGGDAAAVTGAELMVDGGLHAMLWDAEP